MFTLCVNHSILKILCLYFKAGGNGNGINGTGAPSNVFRISNSNSINYSPSFSI